MPYKVFLKSYDRVSNEFKLKHKTKLPNDDSNSHCLRETYSMCQTKLDKKGKERSG